jgi:hypothetical protein
MLNNLGFKDLGCQNHTSSQNPKVKSPKRNITETSTPRSQEGSAFCNVVNSGFKV